MNEGIRTGTAFVGAGSGGKRHRAFYHEDGRFFDVLCREIDGNYVVQGFIKDDDNVTCKNCLNWKGDTP